MWSMSSWLSTMASMRETPAARSAGTTMRAAAVGVGAERRPGVVEQRAARGAHHHRQPLADVERGDPGRARPRAPAARQQKAGSHQRKTARAPGHAARREQPCDAGERSEHAPERRHVLLPQRARQRRAPLEELQQPLDQPGGERRGAPAPAAPRRASASGVTTTETTGIATALASGPATETWPKSSSAAGARPTRDRPLHASPIAPARFRLFAGET